MSMHFMSKWMRRPFHPYCQIESFGSVLQVTLRLLSTRLREANDLEQPLVESVRPWFSRSAPHL